MTESLQTLVFGGAVAAAIAFYAWYADRRRTRRRDPDKVGFMPWTTIFVLAMFGAVLLFAAATRQGLAGG